MATLRNSKLYKLLESRGEDNDRKYAGYLLEIAEKSESFLQFIKNVFPDYPDHSVQHSYRILGYIEVVLGERINELTSAEIFCFILAVLFHDSGMMLAGYAEKDVLREEHPNNASIVIDYYFDNKLGSFTYKNRIKAAVKYICKAHGLDIKAMYKDTEFWRQDTLNGDPVRYAILSVLLRVGDLMDLDEERVCEVAMELLPMLFPDEAKEHNLRHLHVLLYRYDSEALRIEVEAPNVTQYVIWKNWLISLEKEILYANSELSKYNISFPKIDYSIKNENSDYEVEDIRLELDETGELWNIVSQSIYTNEFDFVRETVQNAIDATLMSAYINPGRVLNHYSPRSWGLSQQDSLVFVCYSSEESMLYVVDYGIGMDAEDLRNYLFKVSSTGYKRQQKRSFRFPSIAKYGIGFVSCLINAESISIYTSKKKDSLINKVLLESGLNEALLQKIPGEGFTGTAIAIKVKKHFPTDRLKQYLIDNFRYPSAGVTFIDIDCLKQNNESLLPIEGLNEMYIKPYKIHQVLAEIQKQREERVSPLVSGRNTLMQIEDNCESLLSWMEANYRHSYRYSDSKKFEYFRSASADIYASLPSSKLKKQFPFLKSKISEKGLFNDFEIYKSNLEKFINTLRIEIRDYSSEIKKYPRYMYTIGSSQIKNWEGWNYLYIFLDSNLNFADWFTSNEPIDLGEKTGIVLIKHSYIDYDSGLEYCAINGFLFNDGFVCTRLTCVTGYHSVMRERRKEKLIIGTVDSKDNILDSLEQKFCEKTYDEDEEIFQIYDGSDDYYPGIEINTTCKTIYIDNNYLMYEGDAYLSKLNTSNNKRNNSYSSGNGINLGSTEVSYRLNGIDFDNEQKQDIDDLFRELLTVKSEYCQDGIKIPIAIDCLFPACFFRLFINTTCDSRMTLNVTRHEPSEIGSDVDAWFSNAGSFIQENLYKTVKSTLDELNLDYSFKDLIYCYDDSPFSRKCLDSFQNIINEDSGNIKEEWRV